MRSSEMNVGEASQAAVVPVNVMRNRSKKTATSMLGNRQDNRRDSRDSRDSGAGRSASSDPNAILLGLAGGLPSNLGNMGRNALSTVN